MLERSTILRTLRLGRRFLLVGAGMSVFLALVLVSSTKGTTLFASVYPLELPIFASTGSTAGLMTFASDRTKGVFEYLLAYGVPPRTLFTNGLLATAAVSGLTLGLSLGVGLGVAFALGVVPSVALAKALLLYTVPMSFAAALFTVTVGMIWASFSTPRTGMNSPVGFAPMVGVGPTVLILVLAEAAPSSAYYYITTGAALVIIAVDITLVALSARLMGRERYLSQA